MALEKRMRARSSPPWARQNAPFVTKLGIHSAPKARLSSQPGAAPQEPAPPAPALKARFIAGALRRAFSARPCGGGIPGALPQVGMRRAVGPHGPSLVMKRELGREGPPVFRRRGGSPGAEGQASRRAGRRGGSRPRQWAGGRAPAPPRRRPVRGQGHLPSSGRCQTEFGSGA